MQKILHLLLFLNFTILFSQQDSISVKAVIGSDLQTVDVQQSITYFNITDQPQSQIKLLNWIAAYKNKNTKLAERKLEDRKSDLYFSEKKYLGKLESLNIDGTAITISVENLDEENLFIKLNQELLPGNSVTINLNYRLRLPVKNFTGYGFALDEVALKYFFIVPDYFETADQKPKFYQDIEETQTANIHWNVQLNYPSTLKVSSNLNKISENQFEGNLTIDPEFSIKLRPTAKLFNFTIDRQDITIKLDYTISEAERRNLEFYLPLQLRFIKGKTGFLPSKIFISEKFRNKENFTGNDDIKFWKFKFQLFTDPQKIDLDYFSIISKNILEQSFIADKIENHWFKNGLKTYLEIEYLKHNYKDTRLLGQLPDEITIFGFKPLNLFYASDLKLSERYGLAFNYIAGKNLDQKIASPYPALSNFNDNAISNFEIGSLFAFTAEKMGIARFDLLLKQFISDNKNKEAEPLKFLNDLAIKTEGSSAYIRPFTEHKNRNNFNLKSFRRTGDKFEVRISKNSDLPLPFKVETTNSKGFDQTYFFDTPAKKTDSTYTFPFNNTEKITLNDGYSFPESNYRDNYLYSKGLFSNMKKIKFKFLQDVPNPEFNEIYVNPKLTFNAYDKVLIGINFKNKSLFDQQFVYSLTPYYSTGTKDLAGSGAVSYSFMPPESFYQNLTLGVSGSYFHYDFDLAYRKFSAVANMSFTKNPRSTIGRNLSLSYSFFDRDTDPRNPAANVYNTYDLYGLGYSYGDSKIIHEKYFTANIQGMKDFQKVSAEFFYRWEFAQNKKISFRLFAGYFLRNDTKTNLFDYGISRLSNYSFSYGLLGQSATTGLLSQQFILAEGGFKSYIGRSVNQYITSVNVDSHVWKLFNVYADAGVYKNKMNGAQFIWDSGVKLKIIPDFLEVYLPVQSSLGFEPTFKDYGRRIRFTLIFNIGAITNYFRRGWY